MSLLRKRAVCASFFVCFFSISLLIAGCGQDKIEKTELVYKKTADAELKLYIFEQTHRWLEKPAAAIIFFHGGGWFAGSADSVFAHCEYFAARGMVAVSAQYRFNADYTTLPYECIEDAKSAVRWIRTNAKKLNIDPERIVTAGISAGGHLAGATAMLDGLDQANENTVISSRPDAVILFSSAIDTTVAGYSPYALERFVHKIAWANADNAKDVSLSHNIKSGIVPFLVFHGTADELIPLESVKRFCESMERAGNQCELVTFQDGLHRSFNYSESSSNESFDRAMTLAEKFLVSLDYLKSEP